MSETAEVRLVRCPKCENLLPEVTGYSVYRCGGCGSVLRGDKGVDLGSFSERSDEEKVELMKEKYLERYEKKNRVSETRMIGRGDGMSSISSSSRPAAAGRALRSSNANYGDGLMNRENMWEGGGGTIQGRDLDELGRASVAPDFEDLTLSNNDENRMRRLDQVPDERGSSSLVSRPSYDYEFEVKNRIGADGFNKDGYVEEDRPKILRGLDGRNERLSRYGYLNDRGKGKTVLDRPIAHEDSRSSSENWYPNRSLGVDSSSGQYPYLGTSFNRPSYQNQYADPYLMHRLEMGGGDGFSRSQYPLNRVQEYEGPLRSQMLRRGAFRTPPPYQQPPSHPYSSGSYPGDDMAYLDPIESYNPSDNHHHPSCSCFHCFNTKQVPQPVAFSDKLSDVSVDALFNYHKNSGSYSPRDYNFQATNHHPLRYHNPLSHTRRPSDVNSEVDGFIRQHPPRVHSASTVLHCRPMGSGAPFFTCFNCFELLLLPKNVATNSDRRKKIKCGACSIVIVFAFSNNKLVVCDDVEATTYSPVKLDDNSNLSPIRGELYMHGHLNQVRTTFPSDDYDNSGYDFEPMDRELVQPSPGRGRDGDSSGAKHQNSNSKHTTEVEEVSETVNVLREDSNLAYEETTNKEPPPPVGSSLQEYFEYSNKFHVKNHQGSNEKNLPGKTARQQSSTNDSSAATETDVSSNEFSNTGTSFDSGEASRKGRRASESFFAGIVKKSFKEFSRSNQDAEKEKSDVTINGHSMSNEMIKKAEEVAGPIHPGQYWYDYRAGFWGLMEGPCLGIIPPGIKEFKYPMPEKCAGGNTGIYVNGRELNQKDLSLLKRRGLPTERNRAYTVEISGRVIDKDTGQELQSLGKLAPTMERLQRGFGMRVRK